MISVNKVNNTYVIEATYNHYIFFNKKYTWKCVNRFDIKKFHWVHDKIKVCEESFPLPTITDDDIQNIIKHNNKIEIELKYDYLKRSRNKKKFFFF